VAARWWLQSPELISRDDAVRLLGALTWRGIAGFPRTEEPRTDEPAVSPTA
jgi:hypothetical protein